MTAGECKKLKYSLSY